eukprot:13909304-Ditylum_brightwellii.AAC.1
MGNHKVSRLRNIQKVDAELNLLRRLHISHRKMNTTEKHNYLHDGIYGGRKGPTAIDPVVITTMTRKMIHLQHANAAAMDCDTTTCFNRMIIGLTSIAETNAGTPTTISTTFARILHQMEYHMCTQKGISEGFNKNSKDKPIHGT